MKAMFRLILVAATAWGAPPAAAETPEEGRDWHRPDDYVRAAEYFLALACRGNGAAQESLAAMYAEGRGVPGDPVRAHRWLSLALEGAEGDAATRRRARLAEIETRMTPAEIAEARARPATAACPPAKDSA